MCANHQRASHSSGYTALSMVSVHAITGCWDSSYGYAWWSNSHLIMYNLIVPLYCGKYRIQLFDKICLLFSMSSILYINCNVISTYYLRTFDCGLLLTKLGLTKALNGYEGAITALLKMQIQRCI